MLGWHFWCGHGQVLSSQATTAPALLVAVGPFAKQLQHIQQKPFSSSGTTLASSAPQNGHSVNVSSLPKVSPSL